MADESARPLPDGNAGGLRGKQDATAKPLSDDASIGSLPKAIAAGVVAALIGGAVWGGIEMATGYQIGWIAIGIGFICGFAVRAAGKGRTTPFRVVGAACSLAGCFFGALWAFDHALAAEMTKQGIQVELGIMDEIQLLVENTGVITWVIFAIAVWEGWKFSVEEAA